MKRILILLIFFICSILYAESTLNTFFSVSLHENKIELLGRKKGERKFEDNKILLIKDKEEKILDEINIFFPDTSYRGSVLVSDDAVAFRVTIREPYRNCFIYTNSSLNKFDFYDCTKWVADGILLKDYNIYSTEFDNDTIKRIDLNTKEMYSYEGYFPNVNIYEVSDEDILGVFEYDGIWYEIYNNIIKKSIKKYVVNKIDINNYFFDK